MTPPLEQVARSTSTASDTPGGAGFEISGDGKFLLAPGVPRPWVAARPDRDDPEEAVRRLWDSGASAVWVNWPADPALVRAARRRGLHVIADAGVALAAQPGVTREQGRRAARRLAAAGGDQVSLWVLSTASGVRGCAPAFVAAAARELSRHGSRAPVAGWVADERAGRAVGDVVNGPLADTGPEETFESVSALQIGARRRPVTVELKVTPGLAGLLRTAADLGVAGMLVDAHSDGDHLEAVREYVAWEGRRFEEAPLFSVVLCARNEEEHLDRCLRSLEQQRYPRMEIVVVDSASTDRTAQIAREHGFEPLRSSRPGLAIARNCGTRAARGDLVAFIDADAEADPYWLYYLWRGFDRTACDGAGGPNHPFDDDGLWSRAVAGAPGNAVPVVALDGTASHLNGTNMAFRRELVLDIGFDEELMSAEDLVFGVEALRRGARLLYFAAAAVYHHRPPLRPYLRQQLSYTRWMLPKEEMAAVMFERPAAPVSLRSRLNPFKRRHVFGGGQEAGLYSQREHPVHVMFPARLGTALLAALLATLPLARVTGRGRAWRWLAGASGGGFSLWLIACVPVYRPEPGLRGLLQRAMTASLWLLFPIVRHLGRRSRAVTPSRHPGCRR